MHRRTYNHCTPADAIKKSKKYKALMEDGIISQQEFDPRKNSC